MKTTVLISCLLTALLLSGCASHQIQTSSGQAYLEGYAAAPTSEADQKVMQAAAVEPDLKFPARIGLMRIEHGCISAIPEAELTAWSEMVERLGPEFGEFVPLSHLIVAMASETVLQKKGHHRHSHNEHLKRLIQDIRMGAARQHVDVVLIYEVFGSEKSHLNPAAVANLSIIGGYFIPGKSVSLRGLANALLIDVRNGYPYGTARAQVDNKRVAATFGFRERLPRMLDKSTTAAALELIPEVELMLKELRAQLN